MGHSCTESVEGTMSTNEGRHTNTVRQYKCTDADIRYEDGKYDSLNQELGI